MKPDDAVTSVHPPRSIRQRQKAMTRKLLEDAALELFAGQGYAQTTVDDITSAVGLSRAAFYTHFEGKARVVAEAWVREIMPETTDFYLRLDAYGIPDQAELRAWLDDAIGFYERHRDLLRIAREVRVMEPGLVELSSSYNMENLAQAVPGYLSRWDGIERERAMLRIWLLCLQLTHFIMGWIDGDWAVKREVALDVLLDFWTSGLRASAWH
jgi:AcrR family transcriptional regulator